MIIIHAVNDRATLPRLITSAAEVALRAQPVLVVSGARQTGKSTFVQGTIGVGRSYQTLDDLLVLERAQLEPDALVGGADLLTLDEVQRSPDLLLAVKRAVDERRTAGRFILTGSANLLLMKNVSESLAGRATYLTLYPFTRRERLGAGRAGIWTELLSSNDTDWLDVIDAVGGVEEDWRAPARIGGYPTPSYHLDDDGMRSAWFAGYTQTYLERDLRDLSSVSSLPAFRRLMRAACLRIGSLVNQTELGRDIGMPQPTVNRHLDLMEVSHQLIRLPAFAVNRTKRLIKAPKLYWTDTGLAMHLAGETEPRGAHLENMVLCDLLAWRSGQLRAPELYYWRVAGSGQEVDFVIDSAEGLLPIEIKTTRRPRLADARSLRLFREEYGRSSRAGLLLHGGTETTWLADGVLAAPWWRIL